MVPETSARLILRAELDIAGAKVVTSTRAISAREIVVLVSPSPEMGERVHARLSFPGIVADFDLSGRVVALHPGDGPGELPAATIRVDDGAEDFGARVRDLLAPHEKISAAGGKTYRILIVDDNGMIREMFAYGVEKYFRERGDVSVDLAEDGATAWRLLHESRYDLAIVDYYLPGPDGAALISQIRGDARLSSLAVVAISIGGDEARDASITAGADLFLDKPILLRDLFGTLDRLRPQGRYVTS
jgi:two-component system, chemotaxis family, chemotaxis protein CheY